MRKTIMFIPLLIGLVAGPVHADPKFHHGARNDKVVFKDRARVISVTPLVEVVEIPREKRECWTEETRPGNARHGNAGMVVGGIIGGVIGNQIGKGHQRPVATAAGAVIGAAVGHQADRDRNGLEHHAKRTDHCRVRTDYVRRKRVVGYDVTYRYRGRTFTTRMDRDPGRFVRVRVRIAAVD